MKSLWDQKREVREMLLYQLRQHWIVVDEDIIEGFLSRMRLRL